VYVNTQLRSRCGHHHWEIYMWVRRLGQGMSNLGIVILVRLMRRLMGVFREQMRPQVWLFLHTQSLHQKKL